jgi:hypothetical protein
MYCIFATTSNFQDLFLTGQAEIKTYFHCLLFEPSLTSCVAAVPFLAQAFMFILPLVSN